jgi:hypothetical protein
MAGAGGYAVTISAIDSASGPLAQINRNLERLTAPISKIQKEAGKLADNVGLTGLANSFASIGGMVAMARAQNQYGMSLGISAQRIGISAGNLGRWIFEE